MAPLLRSQRAVNSSFWKRIYDLPIELQSYIFSDMMDIAGASMLRLVSKSFNDVFKLRYSLQ